MLFVAAMRFIMSVSGCRRTAMERVRRRLVGGINKEGGACKDKNAMKLKRRKRKRESEKREEMVPHKLAQWGNNADFPFKRTSRLILLTL